MPGICGILSREPSETLGEELDRMLASMTYFDWYRTRRFVARSNDFAVGRTQVSSLPMGNWDDAARDWTHGEEHDGYTRVTLSSDADSLTIENDRFGMMPLFYAATDGALVFANELKGVLANSEMSYRLDHRGLADLLSFGFVLGTKTIASDVHCLPPGARLTYSRATGQVRVDRYWKFRDQLGRAAADDAATLGSIHEPFVRAVRERCEGQVGVSLSGGYDSRTIMAAIDHGRHRVQTLTLDVEGGADQAIAQRVAACTNGASNHHFVENGDDFFRRWPHYASEMVRLTDGMYYDEACVMMSTLDLYRDLGVDVVLRGHGGELARMHEAYELRCNRHIRACATQEQLKRQLVRQMRCGLGYDEIQTLFAPQVAEEMHGAAEASFATAFADIDADWPLVDQVSVVYMEEYLHRQCTPSLAQLRSRVDVRMPFLDADYVRAVLSLTPETRLTTRVHRRILGQCNPSLLAIVNANNGAPAGASDWRQRLSLRWQVAMKRYLGYERYKHYVDVPAWLRGPLRPYVSGVLLEDRTLDRGLFNADSVRDAVARLDAAGANWATRLLLLVFVELGQRLFADKIPCEAASPATNYRETV